MHSEILTRRDDLVIRRLVLEPGDAMPWHTDPCRRFTVVVRGDRLAIEYKGTEEHVAIPVHPGMVGWDEPESRVHRGVNAGSGAYEEVVIFFLEHPGADHQPEDR